jgi:hypothetical protein
MEASQEDECPSFRKQEPLKPSELPPIPMPEEPMKRKKHKKLRSRAYDLAFDVKACCEVTPRTEKEQELFAYATKQIREVIVDCEEKANKAQCQANTYRLIHIASSIATITLGGATALVSGFIGEQYSVAAMGAAIFLIQGANEIFKIGHRGVFYKMASIRLRDIYRSANENLIHIDSGKELLRYAHKIQEDVDSLDLSIFKYSYNPEVDETTEV